MGQKLSMPRQRRVEYPDAICHVMNRRDRREDIYRDDADRQDLLMTLAETCQKTGWQAHAYCLRRNHFHRVVETPNANRVAGMSWLLSTYTIRLNHRHQLSGHLFGGRYKASRCWRNSGLPKYHPRRSGSRVSSSVRSRRRASMRPSNARRAAAVSG